MSVTRGLPRSKVFSLFDLPANRVYDQLARIELSLIIVTVIILDYRIGRIDSYVTGTRCFFATTFISVFMHEVSMIPDDCCSSYRVLVFLTPRFYSITDFEGAGRRKFAMKFYRADRDLSVRRPVLCVGRVSRVSLVLSWSARVCCFVAADVTRLLR